MVLEYELLPFRTWIVGSLPFWALVVGGLAGFVLLVAWIVAVMRHGPWLGSVGLGRTLGRALADLGLIAPRRVLAMAWLAIKESIRRRIVVVFAVFIVILLFAGWFLDPASSDPARLYLSFVLTTTSYLVLLLALFLSALSLPSDIKNRTIYTVVTKPVRASEIILGRILGFAVIGTVLLAVMALISLAFVWRGLSHTHQVVLSELTAEESPRPAASAKPAGGKTPDSKTAGGATWKGFTSEAQRHRHEVRIDAAGNARVELQNGHWHPLDLGGKLPSRGGREVVETQAPEGLLVARVPVYGKLHFLNRAGHVSEKGISVGDEWTYRSYIDGGTLAAAIWTFENVTESQFPQGLPVEMTLGVFRTYKGDIEKGIPASLSVRNPETGLEIDAKIFPAKKFVTDAQFIPRELIGPQGRKVDLFRDLVADGKVQIKLRCLHPAQYFGAGQADLYLRAANVPFQWNFAKGYFGIWLQMMLIIGFGVMFSTFLSAPIAVVATLGALVFGLFHQFIVDLAGGKIPGGGPFEAAVRIPTQDNVVSELEPGLRTTLVKLADSWLMQPALRLVGATLPDFPKFDYSTHVASGFNISADLALQHTLTMLAFLLPLFVASYFFLKTREVGQ